MAAVAAVTRLVGDLDTAQDAVQDACALALQHWPADGAPATPRAWLIGVARHKAIDRLRREARRMGKETVAARELAGAQPGETGQQVDDELAWRQIAALYGELIRYEPTIVVEANRAVAVAMAEGPAAGLVILDTICVHPQLSRWPPVHLARADLLRRLGRRDEAAAAYWLALDLEPPPAERAFIVSRLRSLAVGPPGPTPP